MDNGPLVKKYIDSGCQSCPKCGSDNIEGGSPQTDSDSAWQVITCNDCGFEIVDVYTFSHAEIMQ